MSRTLSNFYFNQSLKFIHDYSHRIDSIDVQKKAALDKRIYNLSKLLQVQALDDRQQRQLQVVLQRLVDQKQDEEKEFPSFSSNVMQDPAIINPATQLLLEINPTKSAPLQNIAPALDHLKLKEGLQEVSELTPPAPLSSTGFLFEDPISLESIFEELACPYQLNLQGPRQFHHLQPNEGFPDQLQPHLKDLKTGVIVSTGTERSFFLLLQAEENTTEGLVIRDVEPSVKAYNDFLILLLRISESREDFVKLSNFVSIDDAEKIFEGRISEIQKRIETADMPAELKAYYQANAANFGKIYLGTEKNWQTHQSAYYTDCRYDLNDKQFAKLQYYAKSGKIISTCGEMNDLSFLKDMPVSVIDTSNIWHYTAIDLKDIAPFKPLVIWTDGGENKCRYHTFILTELKEEDQISLKQLIDKLETLDIEDCDSLAEKIQHIFSELPMKEEDEEDVENPQNPLFYHQSTLKTLQKFYEEFVIEIDGFKPIYAGPLGNNLKTLNSLKLSQIEEICHREKSKMNKFLPFIFKSWKNFDASILLALSCLDDWDKFARQTFSNPVTLQMLMKKLNPEQKQYVQQKLS